MFTQAAALGLNIFDLPEKRVKRINRRVEHFNMAVRGYKQHKYAPMRNRPKFAKKFKPHKKFAKKFNPKYKFKKKIKRGVKAGTTLPVIKQSPLPLNIDFYRTLDGVYGSY